ncbi:MAG: guanylate kinase [Bacilli bacterium]|nr:guanylate kinase [Bacilli bacterium]
MKKGLLIILSGPSGVGKGTIRKYIFENSKLNLFYSISMTTRSPRNAEQDGVDYYFVSKEEFDERIKQGKFLEWAEFVGNKYGTPKDIVEDLRNKGKDVLLEIEVNGATQVMKKVTDDRVISIFLMPPSLKALENRIRKRQSETDSVIKERLEKGKKEMTLQTEYDYVVVNKSVVEASEEIIKLIKLKRKS